VHWNSFCVENHRVSFYLITHPQFVIYLGTGLEAFKASRRPLGGYLGASGGFLVPQGPAR